MLSLGLGVKVMRSLCGETWQPVEIHFNFEPPEFADILVQRLMAPIRFGQESNQIFFNACDLNKTLPAKYGKFGRYLNPLMAEGNALPEDTVVHTKYLIRMLLPDGKCSMRHVSALMNTSERSLHPDMILSRVKLTRMISRWNALASKSSSG